MAPGRPGVIQRRGVPAGPGALSQAWGDTVVPLEECS